MENLDLLRCGLSIYGLNPMDWQLVPMTKNRYLIVNCEEPGIRFWGTTISEPTHQSTLHWDFLYLPEI